MKLKQQKTKTRMQVPYSIFYGGLLIGADTPFIVEEKDVDYLKSTFDAIEIDKIEVDIPVDEPEEEATKEKETKKSGK